MPHGKLNVIVESATGIKHPSKHESGDSYCTIQCGTQLLSTHVANGEGSNPVYHTEFKFEIDSSTEDLVISVYSRDNIAQVDRMVGSITLDFKSVFFHAHAVPLAEYPLTRRSGRPGGHISISLMFTARPSPSAQSNLHAVGRQRSAPHPQSQSQSARSQQRDYEASGDGYGSSGSDMSAHGHHRRSLSQPLHRDEYGSPRAQPQHPHARPSRAAPPAAVAAHRAMAYGRQPGMPQQQAVGDWQQGRHQRQMVPQVPPHQQQRAQGMAAQLGAQMAKAAAQQGAQVARAVTQQALREGVQAAFGGLGSLFGTGGQLEMDSTN